jgi:phosphoglycerate dehydrogenase-like enzyme
MDGRFRLFVPVTLFSAAAEERLRDSGEIELEFALEPEDRVYGRTDAESLIPQVDAALADALADLEVLFAITANQQLTVSRQMIADAPELLVVFVVGVGTDGIDLEAASEAGVAVINAPGSNYRSVSEHAVALILALTRRLPQGDRVAHAERRPPTIADLGGTPTTLRGATLGVLGLGFIGREVARICRDGFGMKVRAFDPFANPIEAERLGFTLEDDLEAVLRSADVVTVHTPLTPATEKLIGAAQLELMKPGALLVNTSRGGTVDTEALVAALEAGEIAGAGLDVTDPEPLPADHPLLALPSVVISPHCAAMAPGQVERGAMLATEGVLRALRGERPWNLVNPAAWPHYLERLQAHRTAAGSPKGVAA